MGVSVFALAAAAAIATLSQSQAHCSDAPNATESDAWQRDAAPGMFDSLK